MCAIERATCGGSRELHLMKNSFACVCSDDSLLDTMNALQHAGGVHVHVLSLGGAWARGKWWGAIGTERLSGGRFCTMSVAPLLRSSKVSSCKREHAYTDKLLQTICSCQLNVQQRCKRGALYGMGRGRAPHECARMQREEHAKEDKDLHEVLPGVGVVQHLHELRVQVSGMLLSCLGGAALSATTLPLLTASTSQGSQNDVYKRPSVKTPARLPSLLPRPHSTLQAHHKDCTETITSLMTAAHERAPQKAPQRKHCEHHSTDESNTHKGTT
eukprot:scaffold8067_cov24-Tisochrysis_lutea.AAC.4